MRGAIKSVNPKEVLLDNILAMMSGETFGKDLSAKIVGGEGRLLALIAEGKIEADKPSSTRNGKWRCNAGQVLAHTRNMRPKPSKSKKVKPTNTN